MFKKIKKFLFGDKELEKQKEFEEFYNKFNPKEKIITNEETNSHSVSTTRTLDSYNEEAKKMDMLN